MTHSPSNAIIRMFGVSRRYGTTQALRDISLEISAGEFVFITGPSGAGKSTLLKLTYLAERITEGQVIIDGLNLSRIALRKLPQLRRKFGIIFQDFKLIPTRTVFENVALVLEVQNEKPRMIQKRVNSVLRTVDLENRAGAFPLTLSGGEQQRVAVARAFVGAPGIILADEPTASLDAEAAETVIRLLLDYHAKGATVLVATHDQELIRRCGHRTITLGKGLLQNAPPATGPAPAGITP